MVKSLRQDNTKQTRSQISLLACYRVRLELDQIIEYNEIQKAALFPFCIPSISQIL